MCLGNRPFKDELQRLIFKGLRGTGKKRKYINSIIEGKNDPYSVVEEILNTYLSEKRSDTQ